MEPVNAPGGLVITATFRTTRGSGWAGVVKDYSTSGLSADVWDARFQIVGPLASRPDPSDPPALTWVALRLFQLLPTVALLPDPEIERCVHGGGSLAAASSRRA